MGRIALSCSGGGYRATAFHLGVKSYLHRLSYGDQPLLENVKAISTVSGGTISGVVYAKMKQEGKTFEEYADFLTNKLKSLDLMVEGLNKLNVDGQWNNSLKRKNLINAMSEIYDEEFTEKAQFSIFSDMSNSHLELVIFNATEFDDGQVFRFQNKGEGKRIYFGSAGHTMGKNIYQEINLGDIIAASSCFPGGFEPLQWPYDFRNENSPNIKALAKEPNTDSYGLMDGGISDNQGIGSLLLAHNRQTNPFYDLFIVSDVSSPYIDAFEFHHHKKDKNKKTDWREQNYTEKIKELNTEINKWKIFSGLLTVICLVLAIYSHNIFFPVSIISYLLAGMSLMGFILLFSIPSRLSKKKSEFLQYIKSKIGEGLPNHFLETIDYKKIPLGSYESMILDRVNSLQLLFSSIFMKTIRRLVYGDLYKDDQYKHKRVSCLISELTEKDFRSKNHKVLAHFFDADETDLKKHADYDQIIGSELKQLSESAAGFGTTLWFAHKDELDVMLQKLIACGQATICYNLIVYLSKLLLANEEEKTTADPVALQLLPEAESIQQLEQIRLQCLEDWKRFKEDPFWMVDRSCSILPSESKIQ